MSELDDFFDDLRRRSDRLASRSEIDNEAARHDQLVYPFLTHPLTLGWRPRDVLSQPRALIPREVAASHLFRGASPRSRTPDLLLRPDEIRRAALVVEEKRRQANSDALNQYRLQLLEYQALYECVWGILTDGERWMLKRGFEQYATYESIEDLRIGLRDLQRAIGRESVLERFRRFGTLDLVLYVPSVSLETVPSFSQDEIAHLYDHSQVTAELLRSIAAVRSHAPFKQYAGTPWNYMLEGTSGRDAETIVDVISVFPSITGVRLVNRPDLTPPEGRAQIWVHDIEKGPHRTYALVQRVIETMSFTSFTGL